MNENHLTSKEEQYKEWFAQETGLIPDSVIIRQLCREKRQYLTVIFEGAVVLREPLFDLKVPRYLKKSNAVLDQRLDLMRKLQEASLKLEDMLPVSNLFVERIGERIFSLENLKQDPRASQRVQNQLHEDRSKLAELIFNDLDDLSIQEVYEKVFGRHDS